ncbi:hypothetical protein [Chelativorans sp.]|uniref:hypothetical protein n=1 Tax=Chelativorans sp. TaxID=2203393 RepID=UPI002812534E|nr:hypothetical protein [Chelativorans sp.]
MDAAAFLLLIVGCSEHLDRCIELPAPAPIYAEASECQAELEPEMRRHAARFPQVLATCLPVDASLEETNAELVWRITPEGDLAASVEPVPDGGVAEQHAGRI